MKKKFLSTDIIERKKIMRMLIRKGNKKHSEAETNTRCFV